MDWLRDKFPAFAEALAAYRCNGDRGKGRCPCKFHKRGDRHWSLGFQLAENGGLTFKCYAGCPKQDILKDAGLSWKDVCVDKPGFRSRSREQAMRTLVHVYQYRRPQEEGAEIEFEVLRYFPKDFRPRRLMRTAEQTRSHPEYAYSILEQSVCRVESKDRDADPSGFRWVPCRDGDAGAVKLPAVRPTLYNADIVTSFAPADKILLWLEGEKDCDAASQLGMLATSVQGGANNLIWCPEWSKLVRGRTVVFLPDNDTPGVEYAAWYAGCCMVAGAAGVATVRLPGLKHKGDLSDWLFANRESQRDRGPSSAVAAKLKGVLMQADLYRPQKLYAAYGLAENPQQGHKNPQRLAEPESPHRHAEPPYAYQDAE